MPLQTAPTLTPELCAQEVMETVPLVMRFIRKEMRSRRAPSLSVPQLRVLTFLSTWECPGQLPRPLSTVWCAASWCTVRKIPRNAAALC
jgi:hypothetical protein